MFQLIGLSPQRIEPHSMRVVADVVRRDEEVLVFPGGFWKIRVPKRE